MEENKNNINLIILHYLQKTISDDEMKILLKWLEKKDNKALFFELKEVYELKKGGIYPTEKYIQESKERLLAKIKKNEEEKTKKQYALSKKEYRIQCYKYIAIAVISVCITLGIQYLLTTENKTVYTELNIESGPRMGHILLPDGTKVFLNASTKFRYPNEFNRTNREVYLDGEAYFDVTANKNSPFIVRTSKQKIRVLGTKFNVMDYAEDDFAITTLVSGKIELVPFDESNEIKEPVILQPNQQSFYSKTNNRVTLSNIQTDINRTWVNKIYHFKNEPLHQIASRLEKLYGVEINITNDTLKDVEFTGTFKLGQDLDEVLHIINFENLFTYEKTESGILIK